MFVNEGRFVKRVKRNQAKLRSECGWRMLSGFAEVGPQNVCWNQTTQYFGVLRCRLDELEILASSSPPSRLTSYTYCS